MTGSIQQSIVLLACVASLFILSHARPSNEVGDKKSESQALENLKGDLQWESQWWTPPEEENSKDAKDSWKAFKTEKPAVRRRWWEEDWEEDKWWAPKENSNSINSKASYHVDQRGEDKTVSPSNPDSAASSEIKPQPDSGKEEPVPAPQALPLVGASEALQDEKSGYALKSDDKYGDSENVNVPLAESPREKLDPVLKGDAMISPFEDPKPGPYRGSRDEAPSQEEWEYHQLTGFGKYIDQDKSKETAKVTKEEDQESESVEEEENPSKEAMQMEEDEQEEEDNEADETPEKNKGKFKEQFYAFGLESVPASTSAPASAGKEEKNEMAAKPKLPTETSKPTDIELRDVPEKHNQENYNRGIIYDVIPGAPPELTHSVKKDLTHSVKKDLSKEYMEDFVSTKANPQTSPNPPPPGIAEREDSETTPLAPSKISTKSEIAKLYIKSRPLTYCKLDEECRKGRMCRNGMCVCLPSDGCAGHYKPVCGSDGVEYPSHCELHRTACVTHVHIKVDHVGSCFMKHEKVKEMMKIQKDNYKDHLLPQASSQSADNSDEDDDQEDDAEEYSDYDEDEFDYDDDEDEEEEKDTIKEGGDDSSEEDENEIDDWMKNSPQTVSVDSKNIYDYSKDLKKASLKKPDEDSSKLDTSPWDHVQEETGQEFKNRGQGETEGIKQDSSDENQDSKEEYDYQSDGGYKECSKIELAKFKHQLLEYHCMRFEEPNCKLEVKEERDYLTNLMFSYLDMNTDYQLSYQELKTRQESEQFGDLNDVCELTDLIWYDDILNADGRLSLDEFEQAFNNLDKAEKKSGSSSSESKENGSPQAPVVHIIPTLATVGNGLELKCGLAAKSSDVIWRRHGVSIRDLAMVELLVLDDGSLFFSKMGVHHMGNYSCEDAADPSALQIHSLKVQMPPIVRVSPHSQIEPARLDAKLKCHAEGVPKPTISWQMNNVPVASEPHHYSLQSNNELLMVYRTDYQKDTGAYKCIAKNQAGTSEDVASVFIIGQKERTAGIGFTSIHSGKFGIFHKDGYTVYNPDNCLKDRSVHGDFGYFKFIPDNLDGPLRMCEDGQDCSWGEVVNIKNSFLYAAQPGMNRVLVVETTKNFIPVQVIATDKKPMQLHYVEHLDQVWVLCWNGETDDSTKTIVVIRDASKFVQHRAVHTQPVGNHFDQIQALFIAPSNDLRHAFDYGYVTHNGQQGLTKLDLDNMRYVKAVDLTAYDCVPRSVAFVPIGGHVVVECVSPLNHHTLQLVMDYITDAVISTTVLSGHPYVSPDSRHVITVDDLTGKVSVAGVNNEGTLEAAYEVTVSASISDVAFFPSSGHGYLLVLTSADDNDIITINLSTGKVGKMKGTKRVDSSSDWHPSPVKRAITSGDVFTDFLLAPSKSSISIVDMKFHSVRCEFTEPLISEAAVFIGH